MIFISLIINSQIRIIVGKDTIKTDNVEKIQPIIDSINTAHFLKYQEDRRKIEDSLEQEEIMRFKRSPTFYYMDTILENGKKITINESEKDPDSLLISRFKNKYDSLKTFSAINIEVLKRINEWRTNKIEIDSTNQAEYVESVIIDQVYYGKRALLVKDEFEVCCTECVEEIICYLSSDNKYWRKLINNKNKEINISVSRNRDFIFVWVKRKRGILTLQRFFEIEI